MFVPSHIITDSVPVNEFSDVLNFVTPILDLFPNTETHPEVVNLYIEYDWLYVAVTEFPPTPLAVDDAADVKDTV